MDGARSWVLWLDVEVVAGCVTNWALSVEIDVGYRQTVAIGGCCVALLESPFERTDKLCTWADQRDH